MANTFPYQANKALVDTSIVNIVEHYRAEDRRSPLPLKIPDIDELKKHRIVISHPANVKFSDQEVQKFYDADLHYKDPKAIRIWRIKEQLTSKLRELGSTNLHENEIAVQLGTVELIHSVMVSSAAPGTAVPCPEEMAKPIFDYFKKYQEAAQRFAAT